MAAELIQINPDNPQERAIERVVNCLRKGGVIIYPTDTVYGIGCDINNQKAIEKVCRIKGIKPEKNNFSFICYDLSHISEYTMPLDNTIFKLMKRVLPGPYTFILKASSKVPKLLSIKKKTVGIRVPDNNIPRMIVHYLDNPIVTASIKNDDEVLEYTTDPELIYEDYKLLVDMVIDGGVGNNVPSTILNYANDELEVIREGLGDVESLF